MSATCLAIRALCETGPLSFITLYHHYSADSIWTRVRNMKMTLSEAETCIKERDNVIVLVSTRTHIFNPFTLKGFFQWGVIRAAVMWLSRITLRLCALLVLFLSEGWKQWWFWFNPNCQFASCQRCICLVLSWLHSAHDNCFVALRDGEPEIKQLFSEDPLFLFSYIWDCQS